MIPRHGILLAVLGLLLFVRPVWAQTQPPVFVEVQDFYEEPDRFVFQVAISDPRRVQILYVELWAENRRVAPRREYTNPSALVRDFFSKEEMKPGLEYTIVVRAADHQGRLIPAPSNRPDQAPVTELARFTFTYPAPEVEPIAFTIRAVTPDWERNVLRIDLGGMDTQTARRVQRLEVFIFDDNNQVIGQFRQESLTSLTLEAPLPPQMAPGPEEQDFAVEIEIISVENLVSESDRYELTIPAAPKPTFTQRLVDFGQKLQAGIIAQPLIALGIVLALNVLAWLLFAGGRSRRKTKLARPPVDRSGVILIPDKLNRKGKIQVRILGTADPSMRKKKAFSYPPPEITIGRGPGNDLRIPKDPRVSTRHLKVRMRGNQIEIMDCNSKNGTFIEGKPIAPNQWTSVGSRDTVSLGPDTKVRLTLRR